MTRLITKIEIHRVDIKFRTMERKLDHCKMWIYRMIACVEKPDLRIWLVTEISCCSLHCFCKQKIFRSTKKTLASAPLHYLGSTLSFNNICRLCHSIPLKCRPTLEKYTRHRLTQYQRRQEDCMLCVWYTHWCHILYVWFQYKLCISGIKQVR